VLELEEAFIGLQKKYGNNLPSQLTNIAGPSRTADIEKNTDIGGTCAQAIDCAYI
jgi:L-lactate dehydrogenase complex protein LldG